MKTKKKIFWIMIPCMILIIGFSAHSIYKTFRPSKGLPYEQITMEQAVKYMSYESEYVLVDVRSSEEYSEGHIAGAVNIPLDKLGVEADIMLRDPEQMIYIYGRTHKQSASAATFLCNKGYANITEIGTFKEWIGETEISEEELSEKVSGDPETIDTEPVRRNG